MTKLSFPTRIDTSIPVEFVKRHQKHWPLAIGALLMLVLITALFPAAPVTPSARANLSATTAPLKPPTPTTQLPEQPLTSPVSHIQLGLFSTLRRAETVQQQMFHLGLQPRVEKRLTADGMRYAILLGPFKSDASLGQAEARLKQASITYFVRRTEA